MRVAAFRIHRRRSSVCATLAIYVCRRCYEKYSSSCKSCSPSRWRYMQGQWIFMTHMLIQVLRFLFPRLTLFINIYIYMLIRILILKLILIQIVTSILTWIPILLRVLMHRVILVEKRVKSNINTNIHVNSGTIILLWILMFPRIVHVKSSTNTSTHIRTTANTNANTDANTIIM